MADNFKAPVTPIFNGEQFELIDGKIINSKGSGSLNIKFKKDSTSGLYECDKSFEDIKQAIADFKDINIQFPNEDGTVSYDKWYIKATDNSTTITFASGRYENTLLNERCWIEENVVMPSTYVSGASLALTQNIVYSRDYKIKYDANDDDYEGKIPSPRLASEAAPFEGDFTFVPADNVVPTGTAGDKTFGGWYYDADCTTPINFGDVTGVDPDAITHDVRAYAKWKPVVKGVGLTNMGTTSNYVAFVQKGWGGYVGYTGTLTMQYSLDDGATWVDIEMPNVFKTTASALVNVNVPPGKTVTFRTPTANERFSSNNDSYYTISIASGDWVLEGNVMYLVDPTGESKTIDNNYQFAHLFENTPIKEISADFLPATTLTERCYGDMFHGSKIQSLPDGLLPAETLAKECYYEMFFGCHQLTSIGSNVMTAKTLAESACLDMFRDAYIESIPEGFFDSVETLAKSCYSRMFDECSQLTEVNAKLPNLIYESCYSRMFYGCTSLTTVPSDMLPSTTLARSCYSNMFRECTSLTTAPVLLATTLTPYCYEHMFENCSALNNITVYANPWNTASAADWVSGVAATGDFYNLGGATDIPVASNGIPTGWTVHTS